MENIIQNLNLPNSDKRTRLLNQANIIEEQLPKSLFLDSYDLAKATPHNAGQWEAFFDIPEVRIYMSSKRSKYLYQQGYKALDRLTKSHTLSGPDVAAAKQTIEQSGILKKDEQQSNVVVTRIPPKLKTKPEPYKEDYRGIQEEAASFDPPELY